MNKTLGAIAAATVLGTAAWAETVAPTAVAYDDYGAVEASLTGAPGDVENGAVLMNKGAGNCVACHQIGALPELAFQGEIGPALDGAGSRWTEAELRGIVANAKKTFEGTMMPSFYKTEGFIRLGNAYTGKAHEGDVAPLLTAQDVEDVVAFLMTLKDE
ncbi:sulfur oxidation c-type cytochrome SoxX [Vannielia litorea]|uniref:sulfur oxidation c-type cytochrome SoxX n=1 Tax=Vannielia TaxID=2813041 RepID=UPI001C965E4A|nr:sulfur oxidation c-type cytochrome SoxX [Vannielia litorea]MBY6048546.1 sulfur oxidation c-type cytochrome SoxX [Vannielia litorea]MBY6075960.1 sulfur oxidation c-type cytochrome SoxX [Vannielia litorea]MBY6154176.1 sulfur oxidation c-type cytochrome SoxX [Vannielia litorea]